MRGNYGIVHSKKGELREDSALVAAERSEAAGVPEDKIEIALDMLRAGVAVLSPRQISDLMDCWKSPAEVAEKVFRAMIRAAR